VIGSGLRRRALLLLVLLVTALGGTAATSGAAPDGPQSRAATCFGETVTIWAQPDDLPGGTQGTKGDDVIWGTSGHDEIWGKGGDDLICGNGGHDYLFGGSGRDRIQGGPGSDVLYGEAGRDTLLGGPGGNILNGGWGTDRCLSGDTYVSCELPSVDQILAECPTKREIARIDAKFDLSFEGANPSPIVVACWPAQGSPLLTPLQKRAYNALLIMGRISFDAALPWDSGHSLEDWFANAITGIRFRDDIANSFCCEPAGVINIKTGWPLPAFQATDLFIDDVVGLGDLMILMAHEARHAEGNEYDHTCTWVDLIGYIDDKLIGDLGAWGVQYYLHLWLADHTSQGFLRPLTGDPTRYQDQHRVDATLIKNGRFCNEP